MADIFPGASFSQLVEWGYPQGTLRAVPGAAVAYSVIHITGNSRLPSAEAEVAWRKNDPANQNSATFFVNRDGSVVQALGDPLRMDPWSNGVFNNPDLTNPRIAACRAAGLNPNERTLVSIENVGYEPGSSITSAQITTNARIISYYHGKIGLPINRQTVLGHYQFDRVNRPNCPAVNKAVIDQIVALAAGGTAPPVGDDVYKEIVYPWPRDWTAKGGVTYGYKYSPEPNTSRVFEPGSPAQSSGEVTISPTPPEWLPGPYQQVSNGSLAGYLVANSQLNLGPIPAPLPKPPSTEPPVTDEEAIRKAAHDAALDVAEQAGVPLVTTYAIEKYPA